MCVCVCVCAGGMPYYTRMGPGVGAQQGGGGGCARRMSSSLAPLESRHPRLGQSLWWLWVMRPRSLHAHAAPAGVLVCPAGRPGEVPLPSVASSPRVCVCVRARKGIDSKHARSARFNSYDPTVTANRQFNVQPLQKGRPAGPRLPIWSCV